MNTLWITLIVVVVLAWLAKSQDLQFEGGITTQRIHHSNKTKFFFILIVLILIFVAGCRYYVGSDFRAYYKGYETLINELPEALRTFNEPGLKLLYKLAVSIWHDGWACILFAAALTLILELRFVYINTDDVLLASILFVFILFSSSFNAVRQDLAVAVFCCGFPSLRERRFKSFLIICILAFLCHRSAIVMLPIYFLTHRRFKFFGLLSIAIGLFILFQSYEILFNAVGLLSGEEVNLNDSYWTNSVNALSTIVAVIPYFVFLLLLNGHDKSEEENFYLNLLFIHAIVSLVTMNSTAIARMRMYTAPFLVIAIPELLKKVNPKYRRIITYAIVIIYGFIWWYTSKDIVWYWMWQRGHAV